MCDRRLIFFVSPGCTIVRWCFSFAMPGLEAAACQGSHQCSTDTNIELDAPYDQEGTFPSILTNQPLEKWPKRECKGTFSSTGNSIGQSPFLGEIVANNANGWCPRKGISKDGLFWTYSYSSLAKERWLDVKAITLRRVRFVFQ